MNLRPSGYEARELPDCSTLQRGVRPDRGSGEKNLIEPHNAPRKERAISKESRPRDRAACFVEIRRLQQPCARPTLSNEHHREMEWSGRSRDQQPTASVTAGCRSCNYLESKNPRRLRSGLASGCVQPRISEVLAEIVASSNRADKTR